MVPRHPQLSFIRFHLASAVVSFLAWIGVAAIVSSVDPARLWSMRYVPLFALVWIACASAVTALTRRVGRGVIFASTAVAILWLRALEYRHPLLMVYVIAVGAAADWVVGRLRRS